MTDHPPVAENPLVSEHRAARHPPAAPGWSAGPPVVAVLNEIDDDRVEPMRAAAHNGGIDPAFDGATRPRPDDPTVDLSPDEWLAPLELDPRVVLMGIQTENYMVTWTHYDHALDELCGHQVNDWSPREVHERKFRAHLSNVPDNQAGAYVEPVHIAETPVDAYPCSSPADGG